MSSRFEGPLWAVLLATVSLMVVPAPCAAQDADGVRDATLTPEQWQRRVEEARRRSEEFVARARTQRSEPTPVGRLEREAADRAMNDPSLRPGDVVSTSQGFVVFVGRDEQHQPSDFQPLPRASSSR